ncbi:uncharacterized protein LOC126668542 [Mercurialis annua]|uniref:uncharacterized protein LOC126668542 n=1 Tax=Mercurialis annua TaxID=3986 RepID=UPI00216091FB|nr:uncharacterized protein LOC126668542 [Mercurialis annua]
MQKTGKKGIAALKLDMSKAYERVEWCFIKAMLVTFGFSEVWVKWIMLCLETVSYSILHEGHELGSIIPQRGLRHRDPLSLYLFLICVEGLSRLLEDKARQGLVQGFKIAQSAPTISHLFFADDSYVFFNGTEEEAICIKDSLAIYDKNTKPEMSRAICAALQVNPVEEMNTFGYIKDRIQQRFQDWKEKFLSKAGKEVLIKSVLQALPTSVMGVFLLPKQLCEDIERIIARFWWKSSRSNNTGVIWQRWERLCKPNLEEWVLGASMNLIWLCWLSIAGVSSKALILWCLGLLRLATSPTRSIIAGRETVLQGIVCKIGDGRDTNVWTDPWLPSIENPFVTTIKPGGVQHILVAQLIDQNRSWDIPIINSIFNPRDRGLILSIPLCNKNDSDLWMWGKDQGGIFTVKSAYFQAFRSNHLVSSSDVEVNWPRFWKIAIPPKVKNCLWRALSGSLPTINNLLQRHAAVMNYCPVCGNEGESEEHVFRDCTFAKDCLSIFFYHYDVDSNSPFNVWFNLLLLGLNANKFADLCGLLWRLWNHRIDVLWRKLSCKPADVVREACNFIYHWREARRQKNSPAAVCNSLAGNRWMKPSIGSLTCNVDAAVTPGSDYSAFGFIIRERNGDCLAAKHAGLVGSLDPRVAEAIGFREALSWIKSKGISSVRV